MYNHEENSEQLINSKVSAALVSGIHKIVSSQGVPFDAIIGESYETRYKEDFYLFAEVRKDKNRTKISYNIRFKQRKISINGWAKIIWYYMEKEDMLLINIDS